MRSRLAVVLGATILALATMVGTSMAGTVIDTAAAHLRNDPVYVDPSAASVLSPDAADRVRAQITHGNAAIYVAVLPANATDETNGDADALPRALGQAIGKNGAVGVVTPRVFRAGASSNSGLQKGQAGELATLAFQAHKAQGPEGVLHDWISRIQAATAANTRSAAAGAGAARARQPKHHRNAFVTLLLFVLLPLVVLGLAVWIVLLQVKRRAEFRRQYRNVKSEVSKLGSQVVQYSAVTDDDMTEASERYAAAHSDLASARTVGDLESVQAAVDEGNAAVRRYITKARPMPAADDDKPKAKKAKASTSEVRADDVEERTDVPPPKHGREPQTVINNYNGSGQEGHWYGGGYRGGMYYGPGYYSSSNFWEGVWLGEMMSDHHRDVIVEDRHDTDRTTNTDTGSTSDSGGGDWSSGGSDYSGSSDSGGGDWGGSGSSSSDYSGGSDSGGGDWGGGGSDFGGGGGFDSGGGGGGGGGDW